MLVFLAAIYVLCFGSYLYIRLADYLYERPHKKIVKYCTTNNQVDLAALTEERRRLIEAQLLVCTLQNDTTSLYNSTKLYRLNKDFGLNIIEYAEKYKAEKKQISNRYEYLITFIKLIGLVIFILCLVFLIMECFNMIPLNNYIQEMKGGN